MSYSPTDMQKVAVLDAIAYEMDQFARLVPFWFVDVGGILNNAKIESLLVHARNLLVFFETTVEKRTKDDVHAADYGFAAQDVAFDEALRARLNKDLSHLAYDRIDRVAPLTRAWDIRDFGAIFARCRAFAQFILEGPAEPRPTDSTVLQQWRGLLSVIKSVELWLSGPLGV